MDKKEQFLRNHRWHILAADCRSVDAGLRWCFQSRTVSVKCSASFLALIVDTRVVKQTDRGSNFSLHVHESRSSTQNEPSVPLISFICELRIGGAWRLILTRSDEWLPPHLLELASWSSFHRTLIWVNCELTYNQLPQTSSSLIPPQASMSLLVPIWHDSYSVVTAFRLLCTQSRICTKTRLEFNESPKEPCFALSSSSATLRDTFHIEHA